jgi:hypothetical protein
LGRQDEILILDNKEHIYATRNSSNSRYSNHILKRGYTNGTVMNSVDGYENMKERQAVKYLRKIPH